MTYDFEQSSEFKIVIWDRFLSSKREPTTGNVTVFGLLIKIDNNFFPTPSDLFWTISTWDCVAEHSGLVSCFPRPLVDSWAWMQTLNRDQTSHWWDGISSVTWMSTTKMDGNLWDNDNQSNQSWADNSGGEQSELFRFFFKKLLLSIKSDKQLQCRLEI